MDRPVSASASRFDTARGLFYLAAQGDTDALGASEDALRDADAEPDADRVRLLAYRGGCEMLRAARAVLPWDKGARAKRGLAMLDDAVARAPDDPEVRFVRGMTSYQLPKFMGRAKVAADDLATLARDAEAAVAAGRIDAMVGAAALYHHGVLLEERGERSAARDAWRRAATLGPATSAGRAAATRK